MLAILKEMEGIAYGLLIGGCPVLKNKTEEMILRFWRLQSPEELARTRVGLCWDQVELMRALAVAGGHAHETVYVELGNQQTHTFLTLRKGAEWYWLENAYTPFRGVHGPVESREELVGVVIDAMRLEAPNEPVTMVTAYGRPEYGLSCAEFMAWCRAGARLKI